MELNDGHFIAVPGFGTAVTIQVTLTLLELKVQRTLDLRWVGIPPGLSSHPGILWHSLGFSVSPKQNYSRCRRGRVGSVSAANGAVTSCSGCWFPSVSVYLSANQKRLNSSSQGHCLIANDKRSSFHTLAGFGISFLTNAYLNQLPILVGSVKRKTYSTHQRHCTHCVRVCILTVHMVYRCGN